MRRAALLLCLTTAVCSTFEGDAAVAAQSAPNDGSGAATLVTAAVGLNPLSAVAAGLSIAASLKTIFGKDASDSATIRRQLAALQQQNDKIIDRLNKILDVLGSLDVMVARVVRQEMVTLVRDQLSANIQLTYESRTAELNDPRNARRQAERNYQRILPAMRELTRRFAGNVDVYGFGQYDILGQGMMIEAWISRRLRQSPAFNKEAGKVFQAYFAKVLDPGLTGSIGERLAAVERQRDRMKGVLDRYDGVIARGYSTSRTVELGRQPCYLGATVTTATSVSTLIGDREQGYSVREEQRDRSVNRNDCQGRSVDGGGHMRSVAMLVMPDPTLQGEETAGNVAAYLNSVLATYRSSLADAQTLKAASDTARIYLDEADKLARLG